MEKNKKFQMISNYLALLHLKIKFKMTYNKSKKLK
jgi:hypothetical protein